MRITIDITEGDVTVVTATRPTVGAGSVPAGQPAEIQGLNAGPAPSSPSTPSTLSAPAAAAAGSLAGQPEGISAGPAPAGSSPAGVSH